MWSSSQNFPMKRLIFKMENASNSFHNREHVPVFVLKRTWTPFQHDHIEEKTTRKWVPWVLGEVLRWIFCRITLQKGLSMWQWWTKTAVLCVLIKVLPKLFLAYVNDISHLELNEKLFLFVDDSPSSILSSTSHLNCIKSKREPY